MKICNYVITTCLVNKCIGDNCDIACGYRAYVHISFIPFRVWSFITLCAQTNVINETFATSKVSNKNFNAIYRPSTVYKEPKISGIIWRSVFCEHKPYVSQKHYFFMPGHNYFWMNWGKHEYTKGRFYMMSTEYAILPGI